MRHLPLLIFISSAAIFLLGCKKQTPSVAAMPPLKVEIVEAEYAETSDKMDFIGHLSSNFSAVIQPRVNGYLISKTYDNGMPVKKGQLLFTIDPAQLSTAVLAAQASYESAKAQALEAKNNYERAVPLARINAISQSQLDQYTAQHAAAQAAVRSAEQSLRNSRMNVGYTKMFSPIDGIAAATSATVGDFVGPGTQLDVLTTISDIDTMDVDLAIPVSHYLRYKSGGSSLYDNAGLLSDITLTLADGTKYPLKGIYDYTRKDISDAMGSIVIVAMFPNPDHTLKDGQFARVSANIGKPSRKLLVPQICVDQAQGINSVWVVTPDNTAEYRKVQLGDTYGDMWIITSGVVGGEKIVTAGRQKLRDGAKVVSEKRR